MISKNILKISTFIALSSLLLTSCGLPGADARKYPPQPEKRVEKNMEEGKGFRLMDAMKKGGSGNFEFASSNELWRATLDTIDFMPLATANYSGGIIVTDWYSDDQNSDESIKINVRFLTNEVRSDAIDLKIFYRVCKPNNSCTVNERKSNLVDELKKEILKKAAIYEKNIIDKKVKKKRTKIN
tara:strand:+ start:74 stop:625 length:552 start_codon:yes stop_codon:yes gene_type:complete